MSLSVPDVNSFFSIPTNISSTYRLPHQPAAPANPVIPNPKTHKIKYDSHNHEVIFEDSTSCPLRTGDWIVITGPVTSKIPLLSIELRVANIYKGTTPILHFRVTDVSLFPTVKISETPVTRSLGKTSMIAETYTNPANVPVTPATTPPPPTLIKSQLLAYNCNFDDMTEAEKATTIVMLLETLPTVKQLCEYLEAQGRTQQPSLRAWTDRISPAALGILRWIIASNRSCIVQVDRCPGQTDEEVAKSKIRIEQKVANISDNWVQFRFAQGSPDKEQRFLNALKAEQAKLNPKYPTMFAWHGSPLQNWHSIIRHGLDFKDTLHGRAYGHGMISPPLSSFGYID